MTLTKLSCYCFRFRPILALIFIAILITILGQIPLGFLSNRGQVIVDAMRAILSCAVLIMWLGWAFSGLLLPQEWKAWQAITVPLIGVVVFIIGMYYLDLFCDARQATVYLLFSASFFVVLRIWRIDPLINPTSEILMPVVGGSLLMAMALLPHLIQGSLGLLAYNGDEEWYCFLTQAVLDSPSSGDQLRFQSPLVEYTSYGSRSEGWAFQYLLAAISTVSGLDPFSGYLPLTYSFLALSVAAWYLFFRFVLQLPYRWANIAVLIYSLHGLPLWLAGFGYGKQLAWIALTPFALSTIVLAVRSGRVRSIALAGLAVGSVISLEARIGTVHLAVTVAGLLIYWLLQDRKLTVLVRLAAISILGIITAFPIIWYFAQSYLLSGAGLTLLNSGQTVMQSWGPGFSTFPGLNAILGLEPNELAKVPDPITFLSWLDPINNGMSAASPYLAWVFLAVIIVGIWEVGRRDPLVLGLTAGFFVWMIAVRLLLPFPYGYFKLFGIAVPLLLGFLTLGGRQFWHPLNGLILTYDVAKTQRMMLKVGFVLMVTFLLRNTIHSTLFTARGWSLSIPQTLVRTLNTFKDNIIPGSQIYITDSPRFALPKDMAIVLRKQHRLGMQSKEEISIVWAQRVNMLIASNLNRYEIYGRFATYYHRWSSILQNDQYDYYILGSEEDPRLRGLDPADAVVTAEGVVLYRSPMTGRMSSEHILSARGTLNVDADHPFSLLAGRDGLVSDNNIETVDLVSGQGRLRLCLLAMEEIVVDVQAGDLHRRIALDPGVTWYTTPTVDLPTVIQVVPESGGKVRALALRVLSSGNEELDRSFDGILSAETVQTGDGVAVELWLSNPMRDAKGASAVFVANDSSEQRLSITVDERGDAWLYKFSLNNNVPIQLQNGMRQVAMGKLPWLQTGGLLTLQFRLGHERPRSFPLASVSIDDGKITCLDRYVDPFQLRLWGYDDRPNEKQPPPLSSLEGKLVQSQDSFIYLVLGGTRHWIPDIAKAGISDQIKYLTPEQLWMIPPGLPVDTTSYELDPPSSKQNHPQQ